MGFSRIAAPVALLATVASAAQYRWQPNNDWSTASNWEVTDGVGQGTVDLNVPCINDWGTGANVRMDQSTTVGSINLPMNGQITFNGDMEVTFDEAATGDRTWKCKTNDQLSSACPSNYKVDGVVPTTPPCLDDSIVINGDEATQILWVPGQFVASVEVTGALTYTNDADFEALWDMSVDTSFLGSPPVLSAETDVAPPAAMCINTCPSLDLSGTITPEERYSPAGEAELARLTALRIATTAARQAAESAFDSEQMTAQLNILQQEFETETNDAFDAAGQARPIAMNSAEELEDKGMDGAVTVPEVLAGGATMGEWFESLPENVSFDKTMVNTIKYMATKEVTDGVMGYVNTEVESIANFDAEVNGKNGVVKIWSTVLANEPLATAADEALNNGMTGITAPNSDADGTIFPAGGEVAPTGTTFTPTEKKSCQTLLAYAAPQAAATRAGGKLALTMPFKFVKPGNTTWGKAAAASLDPNANYDFAPGAVSFTGLQIESKTFIDLDGVSKSAVAPKVIEYLAASAVVTMALYTEELKLTAQVTAVNALTTTTTVPPAAASSEDDSNSGMMMIIIAAAAGLVLCIIVVVVVVRMGGSDDGEEKGSVGRGVVSFENPMYDDPSAGDAAPDEDGGLYDEPAFNADGKENPMYASNENTADAAGGGYLDVEPDDGDDESDEDSEDDE